MFDGLKKVIIKGLFNGQVPTVVEKQTVVVEKHHHHHHDVETVDVSPRQDGSPFVQKSASAILLGE